MGTLRDDLLHPSSQTPEPVKVDLRHVVLVGMALWAAGLVVAGALALAGRIGWQATAVCGTGLLLGVAMLVWARRHPEA